MSDIATPVAGDVTAVLTAEPATPVVQPGPLLAAVCLLTLPGPLSFTMIVVALPVIARSFHVSDSTASWLLIAPMLCSKPAAIDRRAVGRPAWLPARHARRDAGLRRCDSSAALAKSFWCWWASAPCR